MHLSSGKQEEVAPMITIYFSGTGNSQYIAERFSQIMGATLLFD